tara:strand:- start:1758 stop:2309 length:552 start_codon:yes stop_codon:yes gene_type:complete
MKFDIYSFYRKMEHNDIMLSFKGDVTSEMLTSMLQIMETKLDNLGEPSKMKRKVYNVLVECLQNLYHHRDEMKRTGIDEESAAIFMIGRNDNGYNIVTGNYILTERVERLKSRIDHVNSLDRDGLKTLYKEVLNNDERSDKGGGGLGIIDIARKSGQNLVYDFMEVDKKYSFFSLYINIVQKK